MLCTLVFGLLPWGRPGPRPPLQKILVYMVSIVFYMAFMAFYMVFIFFFMVFTVCSMFV